MICCSRLNPMTVHSSSESSKNWIITGVVVICALVTLVLPRFMGSGPSLSPVSGLMTQKILAQQAMPYDVALSNGKPTLIEFYADWCTTCQAFAPTLQAVHDSLGTRVNFVMLNIDDPQWREPIEIYRATGVPHLTLLNEDHSIADTWVGKVPESYLRDRLESLFA